MSERSNLFAGRAGVEQRYPEQFGTDWQRRSVAVATLASMTAVFIFGVFQLEIPFRGRSRAPCSSATSSG